MSLEYVISAVDNFSKTFDSLEKKVKNVGSTLDGAGKTLTAGVTLPLVGLATAAGVASIDFESAFAGVSYCPPCQ